MMNISHLRSIGLIGAAVWLFAYGDVEAQQKSETIERQIENKAEKAKEKAGNVGDKVGEKAKEIGAGVSDAWITAKTKIALYADERVKGRQINVDTKNRVVTLRGAVDSPEAKSAAEEIARGIEGVKEVQNRLQLAAARAAGKSVDAKEPSDEEIVNQIKQRFSKDARLKQAKLDVQVNSGVVTLTGEVSSIAMSARASETARRVSGVRAVKNELTVKNQAAISQPAKSRAS